MKWIYILLSIKTRIETPDDNSSEHLWIEFISYYPLKQGLKLKELIILDCFLNNLYPTIH